MKKLLFLVVLVFIVALQSNLFSIPNDSDGNNKLLWEQNFNHTVWDCAFMPDENFIINCVDSTLQIRRTIDQSLVREKKMFEGVIASLEVSKDGKYVYIGGGDLKKLDINTFEVIKDYHRGCGNISLSPDGNKLAISQGIGYVLDCETGNELFRFGDSDGGSYGHRNMKQFKFSPDGKYVAGYYDNGPDKKIYVFDTDSFKLYATFNDDDYSSYPPDFTQIFFSPNSQFIVVENCAGYSIRVWELNTRKNILNENMTTQNAYGGAFIFFKDNETLFFRNGYDNLSYFYNMKQRRIIKTLKFCPPIYANPVFNSDETLLLGDRLCLTQIDKSVLSVEGQTQQNNAILKPNPTNGIVTISLELPFTSRTIISILDATGRIVDTITNENVIKGQFEYTYDASLLFSGLYFVKISQGSYSITLKLIKE